ncbi:isoprenylcysteine carboxylmethyltransferase family protein [Paraburkholderia edwinii]|uniref:Isoprenylcysteine carboxylmethyltransferase family protein n=1 Tax=Paraburkholderia edwinii TaxID=2861782 RepID=A0ABX8ULP4_9BURK|nr:isoprenylcysteine carboxylmethyltransferase family protein [Paraburkholderia edwinii]QYD67945.1 isoprenylcysteine carboxylmethyltransferase family protein [Paraburkholderia edwinii]
MSQDLILFFWLAWAIGWRVASNKVKATVRRERRVSVMIRSVSVYLSLVLLTADWFWPTWIRFHFAWFFKRFIESKPLVEMSSVAVVCAGLGFATWARIQLAANWSGSVSIKKDHELVEAGPYRFVRHPIYTGLLVAIFGSTFCNGEYRGLAALLLVTIALWHKLKLEERWMSEIFGMRYERYKRRVAALIPFVL